METKSLVKTVLVVDDEHMLRDLHVTSIHMFIPEADVQTISAVDGREALEFVLERLDSQEPVSLILTDIMMPRMNGLELAYELRSRSIDVPIIFTSSFVDETKAVAVKYSKYLIDKPSSPRKIAATVREVLGL